jgi:predicted DsbA family dithiol-disulfide isomerase
MWASALGVPMPILGVAGFAALGAASVISGRIARLVQMLIAMVAALAGVGLLLIQALAIHRFCPYCCVVDASGIVSGVVAALRLWRIPEEAPYRFSPYAGGGFLIASLVATFVVGHRAAPLMVSRSLLPPAIQEEIARTPHGIATVVDFVDFECPFCRMTHSQLEPIVESHAGRVRVVRRQVPLKSHMHARDAARAACCAEILGKGEAMANALFSASIDDLTREGCERIAERLGLDLRQFRQCVDSPTTDESIERDKAMFKASGGKALPTLWIGDEELVGAQSSSTLGTAVGRAILRAGS